MQSPHDSVPVPIGHCCSPPYERVYTVMISIITAITVAIVQDFRFLSAWAT